MILEKLIAHQGQVSIDMSLPASQPSVSIRHHLLPGDIGYITYLHAILYAPEQGWDHTFDSYVANPPGRVCDAA